MGKKSAAVTPDGIQAKIKQIIVSVLGVDEEQITPGALLADDLGFDSIDLVELVMECEEAFDLEFDDDEEAIESVRTVREFMQIIEKKVTAKLIEVAPAS